MIFLYLFLALMLIGAVFPSGRANGRSHHAPTPRHYIGERITGRVRHVVDGDGFTMIVDGSGENIRLRLGEIDAPESLQPMGDMATSMLRSLVMNKKVTVIAHDIGPYGRLIGRVYVSRRNGVIDVNAWLVEHGLAWVYRHHTNDEALFRLESKARAQALGVWSLPEDLRVAPWEWRRTNPRHR